MCCIVTPGHHTGWGSSCKVIKCAVFSPSLSALGIYVPRLISPSELKIPPMRTEAENVLSISSCWRHQRAKTFRAFSFLPSPSFAPPFPSYDQFSLFFPFTVPLFILVLPPCSFLTLPLSQVPWPDVKLICSSWMCAHQTHQKLVLVSWKGQYHTTTEHKVAFPSWQNPPFLCVSWQF